MIAAFGQFLNTQDEKYEGVRDKMTKRMVGDTPSDSGACVCVRKGSPLIMYHNITSFLPDLRVYTRHVTTVSPRILRFTRASAPFFTCPRELPVVYATSRLSHFFTSHDCFSAMTVTQGIRCPTLCRAIKALELACRYFQIM